MNKEQLFRPSKHYLTTKLADPGITAMPGQPIMRLEQARERHPLAKISLISMEAHGPRNRY